MDLTQIRYFLALSKCLNFTRAAEACNVTQPAMTKSIQRLEGELGGTLILRERSQTQLTALGRHMLPILQQTFDAAETARRLAVEFRSPAKAPLRLGVGPNVETFSLLPLIRELGRRLPGFEITIRQGTTREVNDWLLQSDIDVGVTADPAALTERANRWVLFGDPVVVLIPEGHPLSAEGPIEVAVLGCHLSVGQTRDETPLDRVRGRIAAQCGGSATPMHAGSSAKQVTEIILTGLGLGLSTQRHQPAAGLMRRPLSPPSSLDVCVAAMAGRPPSRAADLFLKLARARDWTVTPIDAAQHAGQGAITVPT